MQTLILGWVDDIEPTPPPPSLQTSATVALAFPWAKQSATASSGGSSQRQGGGGAIREKIFCADSAMRVNRREGGKSTFFFCGPIFTKYLAAT